MAFEGGVKYYTHGKAVVSVSFPENRTVCQYCRFVRYYEGLRRYQCMLTEEYLLYPFDGVGNQCPVLLDTEMEQ